MGIPVEMTAGSGGEGVLRMPPGRQAAKPIGEDAGPAAFPQSTPAQPGEAVANDWDEGFTALAARNAGFLFRVAHGLLRNPQDAEDAVQEALLKLYRTGAWRGIDDERAFLARTVWRTGLDVAARRARHRAGTEPLAPEGPYPATAASAEAMLIEGDAKALLRRLIDGLPEELRHPLLLSAIEEMTSREVGAALGMNEATVRTRVARARAELRRQFLAMQSGRAARA